MRGPQQNKFVVHFVVTLCSGCMKTGFWLHFSRVYSQFIHIPVSPSAHTKFPIDAPADFAKSNIIFLKWPIVQIILWRWNSLVYCPTQLTLISGFCICHVSQGKYERHSIDIYSFATFFFEKKILDAQRFSYIPNS